MFYAYYEPYMLSNCGLYTTYINHQPPLSPAFDKINASLSILTYTYDLQAPFKPYRPSHATQVQAIIIIYMKHIYSTHPNTHYKRVQSPQPFYNSFVLFNSFEHYFPISFTTLLFLWGCLWSKRWLQNLWTVFVFIHLSM